MSTANGIGAAVRGAWVALRQALGPAGAAGLGLLWVALPLVPNAVPATLVLFLAGWSFHQRRSLRCPASIPWRTPLPWLVLYYLVHLAGMAWTDDTAFGLFDLQIKAPLLVLPLLALFLPALPRGVRNDALFLGALANAAAAVVLLLAALVRIAAGGGLSAAEEIFSSRYSFAVHPSYVAFYLLSSLAAWVLVPLHGRVPAAVGNAVLLALCMGVVLCGSKMGWVLLLLTLAVALVLRWGGTALRRSLLGIVAASTVGLGALVLLSPYAGSRVREAFRAATAPQVDDRSETSSAVRRITWSAATTLIAERPLLGTGTGDIKNELMRLYAERGQAWVLEHRLNAHSQFLQSAACLGIAGGMVLVLMLLLPLTGPWRRDPLVLLFLVACALNWAVESMLEVQAGVVFTALMAVWLFRGTNDHGPVRP
jgi:O-antigen ligase